MGIEDNIDYILITPNDFSFIFGQYGLQHIIPVKLSHSCKIHQHDTRIHSVQFIIWML